jgi:DNA-binding CsgD family transcriptional regulator
MNRKETAWRKAEIGKYLLQGLKLSEIGRILKIDRQLIYYYKGRIKKEK